MGKQVLVVTGSPRKGGNSEMMADAFAAGARRKGHEVELFGSAFHKVNGCLACNRCWTKGTPCAVDDDFNRSFAPLLQKAEVLVLAMPLYFYGFPAQIKAPLDKMYAYAVPACPQGLKVSQSALLICGGDKPRESYGGAVETYRQVAKFCGWQDRGILVAGGVMDKGDILKTDFLAQSEELGYSL